MSLLYPEGAIYVVVVLLIKRSDQSVEGLAYQGKESRCLTVGGAHQALLCRPGNSFLACGVSPVSQSQLSKHLQLYDTHY